MKDMGKFENAIRDFCRARHAAARTTPQFDRKVLADAVPSKQIAQDKTPAFAGLGVRRIMMHKRLTGLTAAAIVVVAVALAISVFPGGATPAYAFSDTIKAMNKIETVYMKGEFYLQGEFECWMRFDGNPDRPTHVWLGRTGENLCKICSPDGVFGFNRRSNRVHFALRDERSKSWIPRFGSLFRDATKKAGTGNAVTIHDQLDKASGATVIAIDVNAPKRQQRFLVDPETKLPIRFETVREDDPTEMMRQTLAVRQLSEIRYNEEPPEGIFSLPKDALVVQEEVDCMVDPDSGLVADGMTREEACLELTRQACQAMIDLDQARLESLALFFRLWSNPIWEQVAQMKAAGQWVQSYEITGDPYQEGDRWYVPTEVKGPGGQTETQTVMIKFYDFDGTTHAFSIGSKEKGVVD
ncbi:MAG: hypothetical protein JW993_05875 [Sedimentisphaerales bacterium]|nr:hypothetical protein [Sedimentisphaerales bacterium]